MTERPPSLNVNRPLGVLEPEKENAYPIPLSDWSFLQDKVKKIENPTVMYNTIGSVLLGISGSSLLAALGLPKAPESTHTGIHLFCWMFFVFCMLGGIVVLFFDNITRKRYTIQTKNDVLDEMDRLQKRFKIGIVANESPPKYISMNLPEQGQELTDNTPKFLVGRWIYQYMDPVSKQIVRKKADIDPNGNFTIVGDPKPKFRLTKFNLEWGNRVITFDKRYIESGETHSRERLQIENGGRILIGKVKGKSAEKREYRKE